MPTVQTTNVFSEIGNAVERGFTTISLQGSSRSGKTYNTLIWLIVYCLQNPNTRLSIVRNTLPAIKKSVLIDFKEILHSMELQKGLRVILKRLRYNSVGMNARITFYIQR